MANIFRLKAWVRYDGKGRLVGGGPILQESKPKNGDWVEIPYEDCCVPTTTTSTTTTSTSTTTSTTTEFPSLKLLFDFSDTESYSNSGTTIADLSGNSNDGVFSIGTGNGTPATVTGYSTNGYLNLPGTSAQRSVRLPDSLKPTGTVPFTYIVYMQPNGYSYNGDFPGIISNHDSDDGLVWAISPLYGSSNGAYSSRNLSDSTVLAYSGGAALGVWSVYAIKFDGSSTTLYQYYNGTLYTANTVGATSIVSSPSWGLFLGLRYNQWINAKFNYVAMYNYALTNLDIETLANTLSQRIIP
jgi:hypothetical protein